MKVVRHECDVGGATVEIGKKWQPWTGIVKPKPGAALGAFRLDYCGEGEKPWKRQHDPLCASEPGGHGWRMG